jgi:hypothetical protein
LLLQASSRSSVFFLAERIAGEQPSFIRSSSLIVVPGVNDVVEEDVMQR